MKPLAEHARIVFQAAIDSVRGDALIRETVRFGKESIDLGAESLDRKSIDRIILVGAGKASGAMAVGMIQRYRVDESECGSIAWAGHINVPEGCDSKPDDLDWPSELTLFAARPAGVNEPTTEAMEGTDRIWHWVESAGPRDLVIVLISGGGSALLVRPAQGLTLEDQLTVIRRMSGSGADINQLNTVRKHLSEVKGGGLARACHHSKMVSLILSDVLGDPLDLIASGPTVVDSSTAHQALEILQSFDPDQSFPKSVYECLQAKIGSDTSPAGVEHVATLVIGNNAVAVDASGIRAEALGYNHVMQCARQSEGEAEAVGRHLADMTLEMLRRDRSEHRQDALITGGEPTVHLAEECDRGKGGRNQQLVLAAYQRLLELNVSQTDWDRLLILSGGTDGEDGPTDAAGAWIDAAVHTSAVTQNLSPEGYLKRNDAYSFFQATGGLLMTGPTGTNVCDIRVALVDSLV